MNRSELEKLITLLKKEPKKNESILFDLKEHGEWMLDQPSVKAVYDKKTEADQSFDPGGFVSEMPDDTGLALHTVVDADSSQIEAIEAARSGKSLVIEGPPGTGKSQTIANMIAEFFAEGKKILFVSEKRAAMNIVYHKLDMVGLGDSCLRLHSQRAEERKILGDIYHTMHLPQGAAEEDEDENKRRCGETMRALNDYQEQLHQVDSRCGKSLWQLYEEFAGMSEVPDVNYLPENIEDLSSEDGDITEGLLTEYADLVPDVAYDYHLCPWYGYIEADVSAEKRNLIRRLLQNTCGRLKEQIRLVGEVPRLLGLTISTCAELSRVRKVIDFMAEDDLVTREFLDPLQLMQISDALSLMEKLAEEQQELEDKIFSDYRAEVISLNGQDLLQELQQYGSPVSRIMNREYKALLIRLRTYRLDERKPSFSEAVTDLQRLSDYRRNLEKAEVAKHILEGRVGKMYRGMDSNWQEIKKELDRFRALVGSGVDFGRFASLEGTRFEGLKRMCKIWSAGLREIDRRWPEGEMTLQDYFDPDIVSFSETNMKKLLARLESCLDRFGVLDSWTRMQAVLDRMKSHGDLDYLNALIDQGFSEKKFAECYRKTFLRGWIDELQHSLPQIEAFTREGHDRMVKEFRIEDRVQFDRNRRFISKSLAARRPSVDVSGAGSQVSGFLIEERSGRSLQEILSIYGGMVTDIKPCFMMSPQSVSRYLTPEDIHFDTVIFDEASQITIEEALPCISRADQVIVVGDPRQMPPESSGLSLLDFSAMSLPQLRLKWHYRSRSEDIIAFSDHYFYNDSMTTFPTPALQGRTEGVHYQNVKGNYDARHKVNTEEAEAVVELVIEHVRKHPGRSLGVVCFTGEQENLVRELLEKRRRENSDLNPLFESNRVEPFFVKNIASVQGDERDTIILSIVFGKNASGQMTSSFGSLNEKNGERRLNVSVTRAKYDIYIVASINCEDIRLTQKTPEGVTLLRHYLEYAEKGIGTLNRSCPVAFETKTPQNMETEAEKFLQGCGFEVFRNYGYSEVKTDLALRRRGETDCFCCIEFDGENYHHIRNTRDRDRLRQEVMERMGWKYIRIWSTEWYLHKDREMSRLKRLLGCLD